MISFLVGHVDPEVISDKVLFRRLMINRSIMLISARLITSMALNDTQELARSIGGGLHRNVRMKQDASQ